MKCEKKPDNDTHWKRQLQTASCIKKANNRCEVRGETKGDYSLKDASTITLLFSATATTMHPLPLKIDLLLVQLAANPKLYILQRNTSN